MFHEWLHVTVCEPLLRYGHGTRCGRGNVFAMLVVVHKKSSGRVLFWNNRTKLIEQRFKRMSSGYGKTWDQRTTNIIISFYDVRLPGWSLFRLVRVRLKRHIGNQLCTRLS